MAGDQPPLTGGRITPATLLSAYARGIFPMAESRESREIFWVDPHRRGILPLGGFHVSRSLRRRILRAEYRVSVNADFAGVVAGCAQRPETWINDEIFTLYLALHRQGHAHSLEVWAGDDLAGGIYGVALGAAFFGESMFSRRTDASKVALAWLVSRLLRGGFTLFDTQFVTDHLASLGGMEIPRAAYRARLAAALEQRADFFAQPPDVSPLAMLQRITQTS